MSGGRSWQLAFGEFPEAEVVRLLFAAHQNVRMLPEVSMERRGSGPHGPDTKEARKPRPRRCGRVSDFLIHESPGKCHVPSPGTRAVKPTNVLPTNGSS